MLRPLAFLALSTFAVSANAQDLTIVYKMNDGATATHYFSKDHVRFNDGQADVIIDLNASSMTNIDHQKKQYSEITFAEMKEMMDSASAQMEKAMAQVPPEMRERMQKMMGGGEMEVTVTKGGTKTVAGVSCQMYTMTMGQNMTQETCNTTAIVPPFNPAEFQKLRMATTPMMRGMGKMVSKMSEIQGFAISTHTTMNMMGRTMDRGMEATEIKKGPLAADAFEMPSGYKKVDSPMKAMGKMGGPRQ